MYTVYSLGFQILLPSVLSCLVAGRLGEPQHFLKGVPMLGATPASPPGFKLRFRSEYWEVLCTRHNWHLQFRPSIGNGGQEEQSVFGSSSQVTVVAMRSARSVAACDTQRNAMEMSCCILWTVLQ